MGTSGFILKKREDVDIYQMMDEVKAAVGRAGLLSSVEDKFHDKGDGGVYVMGSSIVLKKCNVSQGDDRRFEQS